MTAFWSRTGRSEDGALYSDAFRVYGTPVPQSGVRFYPNASKPVSVGGKDLETWRQLVSAEAQVARVQRGSHQGPVAVHVDFQFPMPRSSSARTAAQRRADSIPMVVRPDLDKLIRAVLDSLKVGGLLLDDNQVSEIHATKTEWASSWTGADVSVRDLWTP